MTEFFIHATTFAAPFVSDTIERYAEAESAGEALTELADSYADSIGIYAAAAYASADDYHKHHEPLAQWRCNLALAIESVPLPRVVGARTDDTVEVNGRAISVHAPKGGRLI